MKTMTNAEFVRIKARCDAVGFEGDQRLGHVRAHNDAKALLREVELLRLRRFTVSVLPEVVGETRKYTVECHGRDDAMLLAFALDGGWGRLRDARGMIELAKGYCEIISEEAVKAE